ncbi:MAG: flagellar biosynthetic protein FliO [Rhodocyclaceae bacterium]|nr:flagellar biosynthetic protein FliO [Rhodocyclaceae bacterium]
MNRSTPSSPFFFPLACTLILCVGAMPASSLAAEPTPSLATSFGQMIFGLAVVIAMLLASLWLIKRLSGPRGGAGSLRLLGGVAVGSRERVVLLQVADKVLVVGVTSASVNTLHVLEASALPEPSEPPAGAAPEFNRWLKQAMDKRGDDEKR